MNSRQAERWLRKQGIIVFPQRSGTGHKGLFNPVNGKVSELPMHGSRKQLGKGITEKIKKDLGLK